MLLSSMQTIVATTTGHPLADTAAKFVWLLPALPLLGFVVNGLLSLTAAAKIGPADPSAVGHGHDDHSQEGPHGGHDDHHVVRHKHAALVSLVGPGLLGAAFVLAAAMFMAMRGVDMHVPFISTLFSWMPVGDLHIDAALQLDPLSMVMA